MTRDDTKPDDLGRFSLSNTSSIRSLLSEVAQHPQSPQVLFAVHPSAVVLALQSHLTDHAQQDLKELCKQHMNADLVPWKVVQHACQDQRKHKDQTATAQDSAAGICQGSRIVFASPPIRQRSKQLEERLAKLQHMVDQQEYAAMVADVTKEEQQAAAAQQDPFFPTTKLQLSFGLHVIVTMGTFFALGYYGGKYILKHEALAALMGALGLAAGLLLETTLLIMRTNMPAPVEDKYAHLLDKRWDKQQGTTKGQQQQQQQQAAAVRDVKQRKQQQRREVTGRLGDTSSAHVKRE